MKQLKEILQREGCSCVIANRGEVRIFRERGVKDLHTLYTANPDFLCGASVADKVVGKAAAALMILGGVERLYAKTISNQAVELLSNSTVEVEYGDTVPYIINRTKTDLCPMEKATKDMTNLEEIFASIDAFVRSLA